MEHHASRQQKTFRFLSHEEFAVLPQREKMNYLTLAVRAVSAKMEEVLDENAAQSRVSWPN